MYKPIKYPKLFNFILLVVFCLAFYELFFVLPERNKAIHIMKNLEINNIKQIIVKPHPNAAYKSLTNKIISIQNKDDISQIIELLKKSYEYRENHSNSIWNCILIIQLKDEKIFDCLISYTSNNGLLIRLNSNEEQGWAFATFKNDKLKSVLESFVLNPKLSNP